MKIKIKQLFFAAFSLFSFSNFSQVVPNLDYATSLAGPDGLPAEGFPSVIDQVNNFVYIAGYKGSSSSQRDYILIKYDLNGVVQWQQTYDFVGLQDRARGVTVDNSGNIYLTGESQNASGNFDIATLKYDAAGNLLWTKRYNGTATNGDDKANSIVVDNSGNVFICGFATNSGTAGKDFTVIKYNTLGVQQFVYTKNGSATNSNDIANSITWFGNKLYVTGNLENTSSNADIYTTRLNDNNAFVNWSKTENGTASLNDQGLSLVVNGNDVLVCGGITNTTTNQDYFIGKYNASNGSTQFTKTYDAFGGNDFATALVVDASNTYAMVGVAQNGSNYEYHAAKYNNSGVFSWVNKYAINTNTINIVPKIAVDVIANHFYVSGLALNPANSTLDGVVYQITPGGNKTWLEFYNGSSGLRDANVDLAIDNLGRIYLASVNEVTTNSYQITLLRYSQTPVAFPIDYNGEPAYRAFAYLANEGQLLNTLNQPVPDVRYYTQAGNSLFYIKNTGYTIANQRSDTAKYNGNDTLSRIDVSFPENNSFTEAQHFEDYSDYSNFYLGHCPNGITGVKSSKRIMVPNFYPMIDLHYYSNQNGIKYYFVVKPGADPNIIKHLFTGASSTAINGSGGLEINSIAGKTTYDKSTAYQINFALQIVNVSWQPTWVNTGTDEYKFNIGTYNTALPLIIQVDQGNSPLATSAGGSPYWSTYFGGSMDDVAYEMTTDPSGSLYSSGATRSANFPVSVGAQFGTFQGGYLDAFVTKFDVGYEKKWTTYYGGNDYDYGYGITYDQLNNKVYFCGRTSSTNFPIKALSGSPNSYADNVSPPDKGCIVRLDPSTGSNEWSTLFGYFGAYCNKIKADAAGNIFTIGNIPNGTFLANCFPNAGGQFPLCNPGGGAYFQSQQKSSAFGTSSNNAFFYDGFIAKFNSLTELKWSTLFGGPGDDFMNNLTIDNVNQKLYIVGGTKSTISGPPSCVAGLAASFPLCNVGGSYFQSQVNQTGTGNFPDGFLARFSLNGNLEWSTLFGGDKDDAMTGVVTDNVGSVFVTGYTKTNFYGNNPCSVPNNGGFPTCVSGSYTQSFGGIYDGFLVKFNLTGNLFVSTFYGGTREESGFELFADPKIALNPTNNGVYITGSTQSCGSFPYKADYSYYLQSASNDPSSCPTQGTTDCYIAGFDNSGTQLYSSYFGGTGGAASTIPQPGDLCMSVATYQDRVYICGRSFSTSNFPFACPPTFNPYCNSTYASVSSSNSTAFYAQLKLLNIGVDEIKKDKTSSFLKVYPNPSNSQITIEWDNTTISKRATISIYNAIGQMVKQLQVQEGDGLNSQSINISTLTEGVYFATIKTETQILNTKFVKE